MSPCVPQLRSVVWAAAVALLTIAAAWFVVATHRVLLWLLIALVLALALDHVIAPLSRRLPRGPVCVAVFLAAVIAVGGVASVLVGLVVEQVAALIRALPALLAELAEGEGPLGALERELDIVERAQELSRDGVLDRAEGLGGGLLTAASSAVTLVIAVVSIAFLTLFLLITGPQLKEALLEQLPERQRELCERIAAATRGAAGGWVLGAAVVAVPATLSAFVVLLILGSSYPVALSAVVLVANPVPFVGTLLAAIVVGFVTLADLGPVQALLFVGYLVAYNQLVENHLLVPLVYGRTVRLSPLGVLVAILIGGEIAGIVGALLAIPLAGAIRAATGELLRWRHEQREPAEAADDRPAGEHPQASTAQALHAS